MAKNNIIDWETLGSFMKDVFMKVGVPAERGDMRGLYGIGQKGHRMHGVNR